MSDSPNKKMQFSPLQSPKARVFLALGLIVVVIIAIALFVHWRSQVALHAAAAEVSGIPGISSTPGAGNPSDAYVAAQTQANISGEVDARKTATAFVPTITRAGFAGNPDAFSPTSAGADEGTAPANCAVKKVVVMFKPNPESCTAPNLERARQAGVTAEELMCQGCACPLLKEAGYNAGELKKVGMTAEQLEKCGFDLKDLISAGFSAAALKAAGFNADQLKAAGFTAGELKDAGFSDAELAKAGFTPAEIKAAGEGSVACSVAELTKEREAGMTAEALKNKGCGVAALHAAGFTAAQLKAAGFSANDLKAAGLSDADLAAAGFSPAEIKRADAIAKLCNVDKLKQERADGMSAAALRQQGCGLDALKAAGFTAAQLKTAGFNAAQLKDAGFSAKELRDAGFSAAALKAAGFSASALKAAGFSAAALKAAGFNAGQLAAAGFGAKELKDAGFTAAQLRRAGMSAAELRSAGFPAESLKTAGFTKGDLARAGFSPIESGQVEPAKTTAAATATTESSPPLDDLSGTAMASKGGAMLPGIGSNSREARLAQFEKQEQAEMTQQQRRDHIQTMQAYMTSQAQSLMSGWGAVTPQQLVKAPEEAKKEGANGGGAADGKNASGASGSSAGQLNGPIIKAGSVLFAVIDTSINSDENTPIMARIVTGDLNGSKLLGTFVRQHDNLLISFKTLSTPNYPSSIPINAVAIDPDTARTAVSGQVNHHYMLRYGSMFASAFVQGVAQGIVNQGVTSNCLFGGFGCTLQQTPLSFNKEMAMGLGQVGQAYAQHMGKNFNLAPTIRISAGTGIGLLIMSDLTLPANLGTSSTLAQGVSVQGSNYK